MKKIMTLCIIVKDGKVLLGMKKRGFGAGYWNGFGGKVEEDETIEAAAVREMLEEVGVEPTETEKVGILNFTFETTNDEIEGHIFKVTDFSGEPIETEEMYPEWFSFEEIPYGQMWPNDEMWLPFLLTGKTFRGRFHCDKPVNQEESNKVISYDIDTVASLE